MKVASLIEGGHRLKGCAGLGRLRKTPFHPCRARLLSGMKIPPDEASTIPPARLSGYIAAPSELELFLRAP